MVTPRPGANSPSPSLNTESMRALGTWVSEVQEQARRAVEVNGPKIAAAFESMRRAMKRPTESAES